MIEFGLYHCINTSHLHVLLVFIADLQFFHGNVLAKVHGLPHFGERAAFSSARKVQITTPTAIRIARARTLRR